MVEEQSRVVGGGQGEGRRGGGDELVVELIDEVRAAQGQSVGE